MHSVELLAPVSNPEKAVLAFAHGADAIYVGADALSLRKHASKNTTSDIAEIVKYAHQFGKKVYVTTNIIPSEADFKMAKKVFKTLKKTGVDAFIVSSLAFIKILRKLKVEIHLSTQQSVMNSYAIKYFSNLGVKRIVLARELTIDEINALNAGNCELEVFIHGGVCMSYSGRCNLSDELAKRNANTGDCAHSCRWEYNLYSNKKLLSPFVFSLSHKDLETTKLIPELVKIKTIKSLKIEGRMKTINYIATITNIYHQLLENSFNFDVEKELLTAGGRSYSSGSLAGFFDEKQTIYDFKPTTALQNFLGVIEKYNAATGETIIRQKNFFVKGDEIYFLTPLGKSNKFTLPLLKNENGEQIDAARHPEELVHITLSKDLPISNGTLVKRWNN